MFITDIIHKGLNLLQSFVSILSHLRPQKFKHIFQDSLNPLCICGLHIQKKINVTFYSPLLLISYQSLFSTVKLKKLIVICWIMLALFKSMRYCLVSHPSTSVHLLICGFSMQQSILLYVQENWLNHFCKTCFIVCNHMYQKSLKICWASIILAGSQSFFFYIKNNSRTSQEHLGNFQEVCTMKYRLFFYKKPLYKKLLSRLLLNLRNPYRKSKISGTLKFFWEFYCEL